MLTSIRASAAGAAAALITAAFALFSFRAYTHAGPDIDMTVPDPVGDTFGQGLAQGVQHDITAIKATSDGVNVVLTVELTAGVGPRTPHAITLGAALGAVDFDIDLDPATGLSPSHVWASCPNAPEVTMDRYLALIGFSSDPFPSTLPLIDATSDPPATTEVPVTFGQNSFTVTIPLSALGADDVFALGAAIGTCAETTDCAPGDGGFVETLGFQVTPVATAPTTGATATAAVPTAAASTATVAADALPETGGGAETRLPLALVLASLSLAGGVLVAAASIRRRNP